MIGIGKVNMLKTFLVSLVIFGGGWFEEYAYKLLEPLVKAGKVKDLRIGLEVNWNLHMKSIPGPRSSILHLLTESPLHIVECKAGNVKVTMFSKLSIV